MTCSTQFHNQLTIDAEDTFYILLNILSGSPCSYSVINVEGIYMLWEDCTLLRCKDIPVFHSWLIGDLSLVGQSHGEVYVA